MPTFKSKLARYNCCEQVMPVPVIPKCAISCYIPTPIVYESMSYQSIQQSIQEPVGTILTNKGIVPQGYLICDGREISRDIYANLFSEIGVDFGYGDNITTFNLPKLDYDANMYIIKF